MIERTLTAATSFIISDYVPYLWFIPKLQGWPSKLQKVCDSKEQVARKIVDIEGHRERAKLRESNTSNEAEYVPDFVDILLAAPFEDGKPLPDLVITMLILVSIMFAGNTDISFSFSFSLASCLKATYLLCSLFPLECTGAVKFITSVPISRILVDEQLSPMLPSLDFI